MELYAPFGEKMALGARMIVPYILMVFLFTFNIVAFPYPITGIVKTPFVLMALYYWAVYRPTLVPPWLAFCAGILMDLLSGLPVGLNGGVFVALRWIVSDQRRFLTGQPFLVIWLGFSILNVFVNIFQWAVFGLTGLAWPPLIDLMPSVFLGFALFPSVCLLLHLTHKILPEGGAGGKRHLTSQRRRPAL